MNIQDKLLNNLSNHYLNTAVKKVVRNLQVLPKEVMQSGDDSPLNNVWDEICVQVQNEYFLSWDMYEDLIRNTCGHILDTFPDVVLHLLSYQACMEKYEEYEPNLYYEDQVIDLLNNKVISYAADYSNKRITYYLERGYELDL
jgi:hypothetical protein